MKLRLSGWWTDSGPLNQRILKQLMSPQDKKIVEFVEDDSYDYLVVFGRLKNDLVVKDKNRTLFFSQEPLWSPNETKNPYEFAEHSFVADKKVYENSEKLNEILLPMFYAGHNESHHTDEFDWSYELKNQDFSSRKSKGISYIVRKDYCSYWNSYVNRDVSKLLYQSRTDLGSKISKDLPSIIIAGMNWEANDSNILGNIWNKRVALNDFRFSICVENTSQKNYISEKFWDAVLINTVPIYIGCNNILDYVPSDCFIDLTKYSEDIDTLTNKIKKIEEDSENLYKKYEPRLKELKELFFTDKRFNLWLKIKEVVGI